MALNDEDYELSMRISRRGKNDGNLAPLRSLLVHRLRDGWKAVSRLSLSMPIAPDAPHGILCEACRWWTQGIIPEHEFTCSNCGQRYVLEAVIYHAVEG